MVCEHGVPPDVLCLACGDTNSPGQPHRHDPNRCTWQAGVWLCAEGEMEPPMVHLSDRDAKAIAEVLRRYIGVLEEEKQVVAYPGHDPAELTHVIKDIDYITGLCKLLGD